MSFGKNMKSFEQWRPSTARQGFFGVGKNPGHYHFFCWNFLNQAQFMKPGKYSWQPGYRQVRDGGSGLWVRKRSSTAEGKGRPAMDFCKFQPLVILWCPSWLRCNNRFSSVVRDSTQKNTKDLSNRSKCCWFQVGNSDPLSNSVQLAPESSLPTVCEEPLRRFFVACLDS